MFNSNLESQLIVVDIADVMADYTSIQLDIDDTKVKAAELVAQNIDIDRIIGTVNLDRCITPVTTADNNLVNLIIAPLCYFTYARILKMFQGTLTDSGYTSESEAEDRNSAKSVANEMASVAETLMKKVITFLDAENPNDENVKEKDINPRIRIFGGEENRSSN